MQEISPESQRCRFWISFAFCEKDNRPLEFGEFEQKIDQMLFVSATPGKYEEEHELLRAEQIIRPTGLLDPAIDVRPVEGQIDDLLERFIKKQTKAIKYLSQH